MKQKSRNINKGYNRSIFCSLKMLVILTGKPFPYMAVGTVGGKYPEDLE